MHACARNLIKTFKMNRTILISLSQCLKHKGHVTCNNQFEITNSVIVQHRVALAHLHLVSAKVRFQFQGCVKTSANLCTSLIRSKPLSQ